LITPSWASVSSPVMLMVLVVALIVPVLIQVVGVLP